MQINQIKNGTKISIYIKQNGKQIQLDTNCVEMKSAGEQKALSSYIERGFVFVVTKVITSGGKAVGFPTGKGITYNAISIIDNKPYCWTDIHIRLVSLPDGRKYNLIYSAQNPKASERRGAFRIEPKLTATATVGLSKETKSVVLSNVSISGMGVLFPPKTIVERGKLIHVKFKDMGTEFDIGGIVVRIEPREDNVFVACKLTITGDKLLKYINQKQRELLGDVSNNK